MIGRIEINRLKDGYYTDAYFNRTRTILRREDHHPRVYMQFFQRKNATLCGIDEAVEILRYARDIYDRHELSIRALCEGDPISPWEPVLTVEGDYAEFAHLETPILGVLARRTRIATNTAEVVRAANGKPVYYFAARHDDWRVQEGDGYAALTGGAASVSTDAQAQWKHEKSMGTIPHGLIAAYGGDTVRAARAFARHYGDSVPVTVLVDWDNDCAATSVAVAEALGDKLHAVRLDTSAALLDESLRRNPPPLADLSNPAYYGVSYWLVERVRKALDAAGFQRVRIVASGGFTAEKIAVFESRLRAQVDAYGVGSSLLRGSFDFTADVVEVDGKPCAKVGRERKDASRLRTVTGRTQQAPDSW